MSEEKKVIIDLCSSEEEEDDGFVDENNYEHADVTDEEDEDTNSSGDEDDSDWSHDDAMDSDVDYDEADETVGDKLDHHDDDDDKVTRLLAAGSDLKSLNVKECKAYLRKHGLRLSGTKPVCIDRIVEHWRIKDGSGEALYPRSSFAINCKGDVCKGDTVLFTQKVHQKYEKMKRSGKIMGRRTVAGQVVKESYGTAKQQHTFTIEVLWCEGTQKLPPLYPLLVKGRNLYRLMTLRQRWANEADRAKVLSEKHSRGAAARKIMRERKIKSGYVLKDGRLRKPGHVKKPCQVNTRKNEKDENPTQRFGPDVRANHSLVAFPNQNPSKGHKNPAQLRNMNPPNSYTSHSYAPRPHPPLTYAPRPNPPLTYAPRSFALINVPHSHLPRPNVPPYHSYTHSTQQNQTNQRPPPAFYNRRPASNALQGQASFNPHAMPVTHQRPYQNHHTNHGSLNSGYNLGVRELDHFSNMMISQRTEGDRYRQSEVTRGPYKNHHTYRSNSNTGYNHGGRDLREGDNHRPNYR
ncbi:PREDICTED: zinc finger CCCH domain-containing protein 62-like [Camelina sativa]|uniref:Zinc finger CCCH domain-containing protein 62-like n=1 Tax=Camelina sativa TaxID=90675 RepID=A0ABM0W2M4_CAMSA|nr:PREDICTED: zinc finger CCCH domain-containing protein 62-like [Camelina sativa]